MTLLCAYCLRPLEPIHSVESEVGDTVQEKTELMCTNTRCRHGSRIIEQSSRPVHKDGYITMRMLSKKVPPKSRLRKLFGEMTGQRGL